MIDYSLQNLENTLNNFTTHSDDSPTIDSTGSDNVETPFSIKPDEFLIYAENDLKIDDEHHIINCLSNVKRAIECQIDSLLIGFGLFERAKKQNWNLPKKLKVLNEIGIVSPRILNKINKLRNLLEHGYSIPNREKVEDALDVANLFIKYTDKFLYGAILEIMVNFNSGFAIISLDYPNSRLYFKSFDYDKNKMPDFEIDHNNPEYLQYLIWYVKMLDKNNKL